MSPGLVGSWRAENEAWEAADEDRRISGHVNTIGQDFAHEQPLLNPLPVEGFAPGRVLHPRVDRSPMVTVRMLKYSVPAHLIGRRLRVSLRASEVVVFDDLDRRSSVHRMKAAGFPGAFPGTNDWVTSTPTTRSTPRPRTNWPTVTGSAKATRSA